MNFPAPKKREKLTNKMLILFGFIVLVESAFLLSLFGLLEDSEKRLGEERRARSIISAVAKLSSTLQFISMTLINQCRYREVELAEFNEIFVRLPKDFENLKKQVEGTPYCEENILVLKDAVPEALDLVHKVYSSLLHKSESEGNRIIHYHYCIQLMDISKSMTTQIDDMEEVFKNIEETSASSLALQSDVLVYSLLATGFAINAVLAVVLYLFFVRDITRRLDAVADNTVNLMVGKPLSEPVYGNDEVSELDETFREVAMSLEESRTKEAALLEHAANFICSINPKGVFVNVPNSSGAMWGYEPGELIGRRFSSVAVAEQYEPTRIALESLNQVGKSTSFENQIRCGNGTIIDLAWTASLHEDGNVICVAHEITERKRITNLIQKSEERFSSIVEHVPLAVISCDKNFVIESVNSSTTKMFHYQLNELLGKRLDVLLTDPVVSKSSKRSSDASSELMEHALKQPMEVNVWKKDGTALSVELTLSAYAAPQGERYLACFRDISARIEIENAKKDFVAMVSHDLRSPLMSIYGTLGLMSMDHTDPTVAPFVKAEKTVSRLVDLINDFLDLGKMEAGQSALTLEGVPLSEHLRNALHAVELAMDARNIELEVRQSEIDPVVKIDPERFTLVINCLLELIANFNPIESKILIAPTVSNQSLRILIYGSNQSTLPDVVKNTCVEGYSLVQLGEGFNSSALRLALVRAILEAHRGSLSVVNAAMDGSDAFEVLLSLN